MLVGVVDPATTRELRRSVLRPHLGRGDALPGDDLPDAVHLGARDDDGTVIGTCFVHPEPCLWRPDLPGAWRLMQMATAPERRGQGVGAAVLNAAVDYARGQGAPALWCNARQTAVPFYARHGFRGHGEVFLDPQAIPHLRMARELALDPGSSVR